MGSGGRIGVLIRPQHAIWRDLTRAWPRAEDLGVDCLLHMGPLLPISGDPGGRPLEANATLSAMAAGTTRVEVGVKFGSAGYRNPDPVADAVRTISHASDGRAIGHVPPGGVCDFPVRVSIGGSSCRHEFGCGTSLTCRWW